MIRLIGTVTAIAASLLLNAQTPKDRPNIDKLCGCFEVEFKYAETFSPNPDYKYHDREEISGGTELSLPIEISENKIVIQHLLVITDSMIIKHWREEWTYENPTIWTFKGNKLWVKEQLKPEQVKGKWTQTIWEVSDEPRYQGYSQFVNLDNKIIWQNTTDAPLPRREYSVRNDYNILKRTNRISITDSGYIHEQDNQKINRVNGTDQLLTEEKGINSYKRLPDSECAAAKFYWDNSKQYWGKVRKAWGEVISASNTIAMKTKVNDKVLHEYLFALEKEYKTKKVSESDIDNRIKAEISKFLEQRQEMSLLK